MLQIRPGARPFRSLAGRLGRLEGELRRQEASVAADTACASPSARPPPAELDPTLPVIPPADSGWEGAVAGASDPATADAAAAIEELAEDLQRTPQLLSIRLRRIAAGDGAKVLLVVDQLEALFTLGAAPAAQRAFLSAICTAADDLDDPVRVVLAIRGDFLDRLPVDAAVTDALQHVTVLRRPAAAALEETLRRPAQAVGYGYEDPSLVKEMIAAVYQEPGCLPLLQFAAQSLWERRDQARKLLLRSAYEQMGGVEGAFRWRVGGAILQGAPSGPSAAAAIGDP